MYEIVEEQNKCISLFKNMFFKICYWLNVKIRYMLDEIIIKNMKEIILVLGIVKNFVNKY